MASGNYNCLLVLEAGMQWCYINSLLENPCEQQLLLPNAKNDFKIFKNDFLHQKSHLT